MLTALFSVINFPPFLLGEKSDYISIALKNGRVVAIVNLGGGEAKLDIGPSGYRFDDNQWHHLLLTRTSRKVTHVTNL
jgi:leucine-rich repeat transmembrane neuronal protein 1/2